MTDPRSLHVQSSRLDLAGWTWGDPAAPPLLLVHGGRDMARSWDAVATAFAATRRVIAFDLRGHGASDWANDGAYAPTDFVVDLATIVETLELEEIDLVGHSLGGNIAWRYTAAFPERVRRLVVIEGLGPAPAKLAESEARPAAERMREEVRERMRDRPARIYPDVAAAAARLRAANPSLSDELARHLAEEGTRVVQGGVVFRHDPGLATSRGGDLGAVEREALWRSIAAPVLLIYGRDSWASDPAADGRAETFRNARTLMFDRAGHWVHHDRTEAFVAAVREFVARPGE